MQYKKILRKIWAVTTIFLLISITSISTVPSFEENYAETIYDKITPEERSKELSYKSVKSVVVDKAFIFGKHSKIEYWQGNIDVIYSDEKIIAFGISANMFPFMAFPFVAFHVFMIHPAESFKPKFFYFRGDSFICGILNRNSVEFT